VSEVERLKKQFQVWTGECDHAAYDMNYMLDALISAVRAETIEECAKVCEQIHNSDVCDAMRMGDPEHMGTSGNGFAQAIRALLPSEVKE
jgi:hypothetical protein